MMNKMPSRPTFQTTAIYDQVLRQVCATSGKETFHEEQQKAIDVFFVGSDVSVSLPTGYGKSLISTNASDRSPIFSRRNRSLYLWCRPLKLSQMTRCTILMYLGQEDCLPSTCGLFTNGAAKLLNRASCFLQRFFRLRKKSFFVHAYSVTISQRNL